MWSIAFHTSNFVGQTQPQAPKPVPAPLGVVMVCAHWQTVQQRPSQLRCSAPSKTKARELILAICVPSQIPKFLVTLFGHLKPKMSTLMESLPSRPALTVSTPHATQRQKGPETKPPHPIWTPPPLSRWEMVLEFFLNGLDLILERTGWGTTAQDSAVPLCAHHHHTANSPI